MTIEKNLFRYVWRLSRGEQLRLVGLVALSVPFYFASLNVPKTIVNDAIQGRAYPDGAMQAKVLVLSFNLPELLGGQTVTLFDGLVLERLPYLVALSGFFLALVLINGWFKFIINVRKGALGERLLQRIRLDLFSTMLRFTPEALQHVKPSEAATIINNEVEPIGGFVGDAFIQPIFLATQALTALTFILLQSVWLGMIAAGIIAIQALVIPKLRREQLALGKRRQIEARALADTLLTPWRT
jgi:putative ABC transport system ATP-binding protein